MKVLLAVLALTSSVAWGESIRVPGLVLGLRHTVNNRDVPGPPSPQAFTAKEGGDLGADRGQGYTWLIVDDQPDADPASWKLPAGIVVALRHRPNQDKDRITAFGHDPVSGPARFPGFAKQIGGDRGAKVDQGYYWYESTGEFFDGDWSIASRLPYLTVIGLKHTLNQKAKTLEWKGRTYDPGDRSGQAPPGFTHRCGGDLGAPAHEGFCWYEWDNKKD